MQFYYLKDNWNPSCKHLTAAGRGFVITKHIIIHSDAHPKETLCLYTWHWSKHPIIFSYKELFNITMHYFFSPAKEGIYCVNSPRLTALETRLFCLCGEEAEHSTANFLHTTLKICPSIQLKGNLPGLGGLRQQSCQFLTPAVVDLSTFMKHCVKNRTAKQEAAKWEPFHSLITKYIQANNQETKIMHPIPVFPAGKLSSLLFNFN